MQGIVDEINKKNKKKDSRVFTYVYTVNCEPAFVNHSRVIDTMVVVVKCVPINVYAWIYHLVEVFFSCETTHLNWQDLKQCAGDPDAFDNQEEGEEEEKENDPTIDPDDDKNEKAGKGLESDSRSSGSGKKNTTEAAAAVEPNTEPAQVETAETKVEKKVDEQVKAKDEEKVSDKKKKKP